jgi:glycopeptide antibiotics resistance protein
MNSPIKNRFVRTIVGFLFVVHIFIVIKFILVKKPAELKTHFVDNYSWNLLHKNIWEGNYIPLGTFSYYFTGAAHAKFSKANLFGNMFLFLPFGIFLPLLFNKTDSILRVTVTCFLMSLSLESIQLITALGTFDVDDILLNSFGALLGYGLYALAKRLRG